MSFTFGNSTPYDYDLYTTGGQKASVSCTSLIQTPITNYVIIADISSTIQGTYSYSVDSVEKGTITKSMCPFLISDISGLQSINCTITFTPSENSDGTASLFYYTASRYTPIVKTQIRQTTEETTVNGEIVTSTVEEVINNTNGYESFQKMSTQLYAYTLTQEPDRIILLTQATLTDTATYFSGTGVRVLNEDGTLNLQWEQMIDEFGYGPKDLTVYDNSNNYYRIPLIIEYLEDGSFTSYVNKNLIVSYSGDANGLIYTYTPSSRTIGVLVNESDLAAGTSALAPGRYLEVQRDSETGVLVSPARVFYEEFQTQVYRTYEYKNTFVHTNRAPTVAAASFTVATYNIETVESALGTSVAEILGNADFSFNDENAEYDARGIIVGGPQVSSLTGNWGYRFDGDAEWTAMTFTNENLTDLFWYLPEKKSVSGLLKDVYIKFLTASNQNGTASLQVYGWDRTNTSGPTEGPERAELIPYSDTGAVSALAGTIIQAIEKINYPPYYDNTIGATYTTVNQDTTVLLTFDDTFFSTIGFLDLSSPGPGVGIVIEDVSGSSIGSWSWKFQNDSDWLNFQIPAGQGLHIKQFNVLENNVVVRFVPDTYKYGTVSFRARLWDTSVNVSNGTYASMPAVFQPNGSYSEAAKTWNVVVSNLADPPKIYNSIGGEITNTFTKNIITYGQGFTPADDGSDSISVFSILDEFGLTRAFESRIIDVDNGFVEFNKSSIGIAIEDISGPLDISFQRLVSAGNWRTYDPSDFTFGNQQDNFLHLNSTDIIRFVVPQSALGANLITFRFRIWNRLNATLPAISASINSYNLISTNGPHYSIPISASISYDDTNQAPVINITEPTFNYSLGSQHEDSGDSSNFDIGEIIQTLRNTTNNGQPLITDVDGDYITQIPLFGLALAEVPAVADFPNPGTWKYRADANAEAVSLNFANGFFHVASGVGDVQPKLFYAPERHTFGTIKLVARIWDRSNEADVSAGMYRPYNGSYDRIAPYSAKTITFVLNIEGSNDRPTALSGRLRLSHIPFTAGNNNGESLFDILRNSTFVVYDPDPQDYGNHGIAIVTAPNDRFGRWQYSLTAGNWLNIPDEPLKALHLDSKPNGIVNTDVRMRYIPNPDLPSRIRTGVRLFQFYIWDKTNGISNGDFIEISPATDTSYSLIVYNGRVRVV
jgi:hypothetical protein